MYVCMYVCNNTHRVTQAQAQTQTHLIESEKSRLWTDYPELGYTFDFTSELKYILNT